ADDAQCAVGERAQHAAVRDAAGVEVPLLDAQPDDDAAAVALGVERPERGEEGAAAALELLEAPRNVCRLAHPCPPSRSMRPIVSARSAWRAITHTHWMRLAKRGSRVWPST